MNRRLQSIDFVRGIAVVAMIQTHVWEHYVARPNGSGLFLLNWLVGPIGGYAAPLFILVSGLSAYFSVLSLRRRGYGDRKASFSKFFVRGGFLFMLSTVINVLIGPILHVVPASVLNWSTIQLIGSCLFLMPLFVRLGWTHKALWLAAPLLLSELHNLHSELVPHLFGGFSPPFPWASLFFAGVVAGEAYTLALEKFNLERLAVLAMVGALLVGPMAFLLHRFYRPFDPNHASNPSITSVSVFVGVFLFSLLDKP